MVPGAIVVLEQFPRTSTGKIDRRALPSPDGMLDPSYVAPRTPTETMLAALWQKVLKLDRVGIDDNFFSLGGHSLLAMQLFLQVHGALQVDLSLHHLFQTPTIRGLAGQLDALRVPEADEAMEEGSI
jgi:hypothetical protein